MRAVAGTRTPPTDGPAPREERAVDPLERELRRMAVLHRRSLRTVRRAVRLRAAAP